MLRSRPVSFLSLRVLSMQASLQGLQLPPYSPSQQEGQQAACALCEGHSQTLHLHTMPMVASVCCHVLSWHAPPAATADALSLVAYITHSHPMQQRFVCTLRTAFCSNLQLRCQAFDSIYAYKYNAC